VTEYLYAEEGPGVRFAIARAAVETVVAHAALAIPGALGVPGLLSRLPGRRPTPRIELTVRERQLFVRIGLAVRHGTVIPELGRAVQQAVGAAAENATGLPVAAVDVRIEAVEPR
jgi:uncharacterized alkaline shock family protein YloU